MISDGGLFGLALSMVMRLKIYQKDLNGSENRGLDWRSEDEENLEAEPIPKSA
jgi:hypothetical protein